METWGSWRVGNGEEFVQNTLCVCRKFLSTKCIKGENVICVFRYLTSFISFYSHTLLCFMREKMGLQLYFSFVNKVQYREDLEGRKMEEETSSFLYYITDILVLPGNDLLT